MCMYAAFDMAAIECIDHILCDSTRTMYTVLNFYIDMKCTSHTTCTHAALQMRYLAFLVISESVLMLHPAITGIAQAATGYTQYVHVQCSKEPLVNIPCPMSIPTTSHTYSLKR